MSLLTSASKFVQFRGHSKANSRVQAVQRVEACQASHVPLQAPKTQGTRVKVEQVQEGTAMWILGRRAEDFSSTVPLSKLLWMLSNPRRCFKLKSNTAFPLESSQFTGRLPPGEQPKSTASPSTSPMTSKGKPEHTTLQGCNLISCHSTKQWGTCDSCAISAFPPCEHLCEPGHPSPQPLKKQLLWEHAKQRYVSRTLHL